MSRILPIYCLSGFISLAFQVGWFRILTDHSGSTTLTYALVLCNFIGGLGVGALLSQRLTTTLGRRLGIHDRIRLYGLLEIAVGATALLTLGIDWAPQEILGEFPYTLHTSGVWVQTPAYQVIQIAVATTCVFVPCFFMGTTFPLLCQTFILGPDGGRFPSLLYAWNTLGACAGVLVCQFALILWLGHEPMFQSMIVLNLLLGSYCFATGGDPDLARRDREAEANEARPDTHAPGWVSAMLMLASLSGFAAGALEGDLFKRIGFLVPRNPGAAMPFISFWAVLAIFLASSMVNRLRAITMTHVKIFFVAGLAYYLAVWRFHDAIMFAAGPEVSADGHFAFPGTMLQLFVYVGIFTFPVFFCLSTLLPYVCNRMQIGNRHLGLAYGLNTLAFCFGVCAFTLLAPLGNIFFSLKLFLATLSLVVLFFLTVSEHKPLRVWQPAILIVALIAAVVFTSTEFDRDYFFEGSRPNRLPVRAVKANAAFTTFVTTTFSDPKEQHGATLFFGRMTMSGTNDRAQAYMRLMAHFPLLAQLEPTRGLLICFGVGNTASAIAAHESIKAIDVVDLNRNVLATAPEFSDYNREVYRDPRVRLIHDDGRNFLGATSETYDLITSEPPPPLAAGTYRLYSKEYYEEVLGHLSEEGMMTQWLPIYQMPREASELIISTFIRVFPETLLFRGYDDDLILLGSKSPIRLDRMDGRAAGAPSVIEDLAALGVSRGDDLRMRVVYDDKELRERFATAPVISDQRNDLDHLFIDRTKPGPKL